MPHSRGEVDLVKPGDVESSPGAQVVDERSLGHVLRHYLQGGLLYYQAQQLDQVRVPQGTACARRGTM